MFSILELYTLDNDSDPVIINPSGKNREPFNLAEALFNKFIVDWIKKYENGCLSFAHLETFYKMTRDLWVETNGENHSYTKIIDAHQKTLFSRLAGLKNCMHIHADILETITHLMC